MSILDRAMPHEHDFGDYCDRSVRMCTFDDCTEMRVGENGGWRELTPTERTQATLIMWEDVIYAQAFQIIHGKDRGVATYRRLVGYDQ